jgi:hypothetical protein
MAALPDRERGHFFVPIAPASGRHRARLEARGPTGAAFAALRQNARGAAWEPADFGAETAR